MSWRCLSFMLPLAALAVGCGGPAHSEREIERASTGLAETGDSPPSLADVQGKIAAVFVGAVRMSAGRGPAFVVGDFNGDRAQDIAVAVKPAPGALWRINSPVASWILKDVEPQPARDIATGPAPVGVEANDVLLAVIHGYGDRGWHDPAALQTYLLRHAVRDSMQSRPLEELIVQPGRKFSGDVIVGAREGRRGFLYWNGATYLWHPL